MNTATTVVETPEPSAPSAEVATAFADLDRARAALRSATEEQREMHNALRRYAYKYNVKRKEARSIWRQFREVAFHDLVRAELGYDRALRDFRRIAMIAALTRVIDTDRRIHGTALGPLVMENGTATVRVA